MALMMMSYTMESEDHPTAPRTWRHNSFKHYTNAPKKRGRMWYDDKNVKMKSPPEGWSPRK